MLKFSFAETNYSWYLSRQGSEDIRARETILQHYKPKQPVLPQKQCLSTVRLPYCTLEYFGEKKSGQGNAKVMLPGKLEGHTEQTLFPLRKFIVENY